MTIVALLAAVVIAPSGYNPADTLLRPGPVVGVSPMGGVPAVEPTLAVDPRDPDRMVAAAMTFPDGAEGPVVRTYWTADGGMSWVPGELDPGTARGADPMLAWAPDGRVHLFHLGRAHHVSEDGGRTWQAAPPLPDGTWDYPQVAVDRSGGPHHGRIYLWVAGFRRGDDGRRLYPLTLLRSDRSGQDFRIHRELLPGDVNYQVAGVVAREDGSLVASFHEIERAGEYLRVPRLWTVPFDPGGDGEAVPALAQRRFVAESPALASVPGGDVAMTWTGLPSGEPGSEGRIAVARSEDGGLTWSEPVTVDLIPAGVYLPHHGMLAAAPGGGLLLTWQRPTPELGERCFQLHTAWSGPGMGAFTTPVPVAPEGSCGTAGGNERPVGGEGTAPVSRRFGDGGDYHGLVALPDGTFQVLWSDAREGAYRVWTARVAPPAANPGAAGGL